MWLTEDVIVELELRLIQHFFIAIIVNWRAPFVAADRSKLSQGVH